MTSWAVACKPPLSIGFPGENTGVGCHFLLQGIFLTQGSNQHLLHWQVDSLPLSHPGSIFGISIIQFLSSFLSINVFFILKVKVKSLSLVQLFATRWTIAYQASPYMGFCRQEYWSGLPFPPPGDLLDPRDRIHISHIGRWILYH